MSNFKRIDVIARETGIAQYTLFALINSARARGEIEKGPDDKDGASTFDIDDVAELLRADSVTVSRQAADLNAEIMKRFIPLAVAEMRNEIEQMMRLRETRLNAFIESQAQTASQLSVLVSRLNATSEFIVQQLSMINHVRLAPNSMSQPLVKLDDVKENKSQGELLPIDVIRLLHLSKLELSRLRDSDRQLLLKAAAEIGSNHNDPNLFRSTPAKTQVITVDRHDLKTFAKVHGLSIKELWVLVAATWSRIPDFEALAASVKD